MHGSDSVIALLLSFQRDSAVALKREYFVQTKSGFKLQLRVCTATRVY